MTKMRIPRELRQGTSLLAGVVVLSAFLGPGSTMASAEVDRSDDWAFVDAGVTHTCALRPDQSLWCWGDNHYGQLGLGDRKQHVKPTQVAGAHDWALMSAGDRVTCGIRTDATLWCW